MNGNSNSKMKLVGSTRARSIDFSDLVHQIPKAHETKQMKTTNESPPELEDGEEGYFGDKLDVTLGRNRSVSSTTSHRLSFQGTVALQNAMRKAFSMRRSSSVSERYGRIYDQCDERLLLPFGDEGDGEDEKRRKKKQKRRSGRILKACKRIFGL
ncbi:hypothetical protein NMG60_11036731 [Bertholletia excelsa]